MKQNDVVPKLKHSVNPVLEKSENENPVIIWM
jgi:hypothetical protein